MASSCRILIIACCIVTFRGDLIWAADAGSVLTSEQILSHPEMKGALATIDAWLSGVRIYDKIPGVSVGIVHDQDLLWAKGYGYTNLQNKQHATADTIYSICSISKLFTAIAIMQLRDARQLTLRDSAYQHLDWLDIEQTYTESGNITIESILTHSSGLPRESDYPYWNGPNFNFPTRAQMIERLKTQHTLYPAEYIFQYSNLGFALAGEIVHSLSGEPFQDYVIENILVPLNLSNTRPYYPVELRGDEMATGYSGMDRSGSREPVQPFRTNSITPAAGFTSLVADLGRFASWQFRLLKEGGKDVLDANTLREMHRVHWVDPDWKNPRGLGFNIRRIEDKTVIGHSGHCPGYATNFSIIPKDQLAAIVLTNSADAPAEEMALNLLKVIALALAKMKTAPETTEADLLMYEGNYEARPWGGELAIRQWGNQLAVIDIPSDDLLEATIKLVPLSSHTFVRVTDHGEPRETWVFEPGDNAKADRIYRHSIYFNRIN